MACGMFVKERGCDVINVMSDSIEYEEVCDPPPLRYSSLRHCKILYENGKNCIVWNTWR